MGIVLYMAVIGTLEAAIYLWRYRSASKESHWSSAMSSGAVQLVRVLGIGGVAHALDNDAVDGSLYVVAAATYVVVPVAVTGWLHWLVERGGGNGKA